MTDELNKIFSEDTDGLLTYEYLANNCESSADQLECIIDNLVKVDRYGQFSASAARYLNAIDPAGYAPHIATLVDNVIERDREHNYLGSLLPDLWGADFLERAEELSATDRTFRRIYQRLYPKGF